MLNGITWQGLHSQLHFGATTKERKTPPPPKDRITDRVAFSSVTEDFTALFGKASYGERTLKYKFVISELSGPSYLEERVNQFTRWLYEPIGKSELYDDRREGYHYMATCTDIADPVYIGGVVAEITVTFAADPFLLSNRVFLPSEARWPDVDFDGSANAADASIILDGAVTDGAGDVIPLTDEQKLRADADRDGSINASDAVDVLDFVAEVGAGNYPDSPEGWAQFMNDRLADESGVL